MKHKIFPKQIGGLYTLKKEIHFLGANYVFALYSDKRAKYYFGKFWHKSMESSKRKYLINEINSLRYLDKHKTSTLNVSIPKLKYTFVSDNLCFYLSAHIKGKDLLGLRAEKQIKHLEAAIDFLHRVKIKKREMKKINTRNPGFYLLSFPYLFVKSSLNYPKRIPLFLKSFIRFYINSPSLYGRKMVLNHRDLNLGNFIIKGKKTYIIDFQLFALTVPEFEYASILRSVIRNKNLTGQFIELLKSKYTTSKDSLNSLRAALIYYAMMGLIDRKFAKNRTEDFVSALYFSVTI